MDLEATGPAATDLASAQQVILPEVAPDAALPGTNAKGEIAFTFLDKPCERQTRFIQVSSCDEGRLHSIRASSPLREELNMQC